MFILLLCFRVILHVGFIAPLFLTVLWIKPLSRDPLTVKIYR
jgi:hypothetical protein